MKKIAVIDGNSLMHRGFHAVPDYMTADNGKHTNAVFGFLQMLLKMVDSLEPDGVICAFDAGIPDFRMEAISRYKAQRPPTDPFLKEQFPLIESVLDALKIPVVKIAGWEGDDILGSLSKKGEELGFEVLLVSGDRDILQLASEKTKVVHTKTGMSDVVVYGPDEVVERYGIGPDQVPDFISLKGDTSDNIPGVAGIGEKTAAKLLQKYGSVREVIAHAEELRERQRNAISSSIDEIEAGLLVATIVRDLEIDIDLESISFPTYSVDDIRDIFKELNMNQHFKKFVKLSYKRFGVPEGEDESAETLFETTRIDAPFIASGTLAQTLLDEFADDGREVSVLVERLGTATLFGATQAMAVCDGKKAAIVEDEAILDALVRILGSNKIVSMDVKELLQTRDSRNPKKGIIPTDSSIVALVDIDDVDMGNLFDTSIAAYLLASDASKYTLEDTALRYLGCEIPKSDEYDSVMGSDAMHEILSKRAMALFMLGDVLREKLVEDGSIDVFTNIDMALIPALLSIERSGMELDVDRLAEIGSAVEARVSELEAQIFDLAGEPFNIASPKQLSKVLFEDLGLPAKKKTRTGYSTDASVLAELVAEHPIVELVIEYRELTKIKGTYIDALPKLVRGDGRIHTTLNQTITATGRLSSSDPNLQNIPVRTELGRLIRTAFPPYSEMGKAGDDVVFLSADYSQIELRLLAALSGDEGLIAAFNAGGDFHSATASRVFDIPVDEVTTAMRSKAKAVNFGIVYGQQAFGLSQSLGIPMWEAQEMIDRYFAAYPQVKVYLDGLIAQASAEGCVPTMFGRKRHVRELASGNRNTRSAGERIAMNHPMQGSAADIIKLAMAGVRKRLSDDGFESAMLLQVHDELDFSCPVSEVERLSAMVVDVMENVVELPVRLEVSVSYGRTWADAK